MKFVCGFVWIDATHYLPLARTADASGWDGVVLSDHLVHVEKIASRYPYHESGERQPVGRIGEVRELFGRRTELRLPRGDGRKSGAEGA